MIENILAPRFGEICVIQCRHRVRDAHIERIVAPQHDTIAAHAPAEHLQDLDIVRDRIEVELQQIRFASCDGRTVILNATTVTGSSIFVPREDAAMKIKRWRTFPVTLPDEDPEWKFAGQAYPKNDAVVVALEAEDGTVGYGYAAAFPHLGATQMGVQGALERMLPLIVDKPALDIEAHLRAIDQSIRDNHPAKSGIDCALYDLAARILKVPLYQLFGGKVRSDIALSRMLALKQPAQMAQKARHHADEGYRCIKLKVGGDLREDEARVRAVRKAVGDSVRLTIDPNMSYSAKKAIACAERVAQYGVEMIEQPVRFDDLDGLAAVTRAVSIAVEADESAFSPQSTYHLAAGGVVDAVSLKVSKMGGLRNVLAAARICEAARLGCRMGATVGSRLLAAHAAHLVAALPHLTFPCELAEFEHLMNDPFEGLEVKDGMLKIPDEVGPGVRLRGDVDWRC